jgi:hypothetical protein
LLLCSDVILRGLPDQERAVTPILRCTPGPRQHVSAQLTAQQSDYRQDRNPPAHLGPKLVRLSTGRNRQSVGARAGELEVFVDEEAEDGGELREENEEVGVCESWWITHVSVSSCFALTKV